LEFSHRNKEAGDAAASAVKGSLEQAMGDIFIVMRERTTRLPRGLLNR
jgi:hypothetical protein